MAHETGDAAAVNALVALRRRWWAATGLAALALAAGYAGLSSAWGVGFASRWATFAAAVLALILAIVWRNLPHNHLPGGGLLASLGPANWVTILRSFVLALLAGFIVLPRPVAVLAWAPALLYTVAILADLLDGAVARLTGRVTVLGATLDMEFDGLGMLIAVALAVRYAQLPWPYLLVGAARYLFVAGLWRLARQGRPAYPLTPSTFRRIAAGLQMAFVSVVLWPLFGPPATLVAGACFGLPFLAGFARDWLVVSGAVDPASIRCLQAMRWFAGLKRWLPPVLRLCAAVVAAGFLAPRLGSGQAPDGLLSGAVGIVALLAAGLLLFGVASRLAALGLLAAVCVDLVLSGYQLYHAVLLAAIIGVLYLGGGAVALWSVDDALFERGARRRR